jgi:hypothetical protein
MTSYPSEGAATFTELHSALLERFEETAAPWDASPTIVAARASYLEALGNLNRSYLLMVANTRAQRNARERKASEAQARADREQTEAKARADREARHVLQTEQERLERLKRAKDYLAQQTKA